MIGTSTQGMGALAMQGFNGASSSLAIYERGAPRTGRAIWGRVLHILTR